MKFSAAFSNPPYSIGTNKTIWRDFVVLLVKSSDKFTTIHPGVWKDLSKYSKLRTVLLPNITYLYVGDRSLFEGVGVRTDWYIYDPTNSKDTFTLQYHNGSNFDKHSDIIYNCELLPDEYAFLKTHLDPEHNNGVINGSYTYTVRDVYNHNDPGPYRIIGGAMKDGVRYNTSWCLQDSRLDPQEPVYNCSSSIGPYAEFDKVVLNYAGVPRARFITKEEQIGCIRTFHWNISDRDIANNLVSFLNSKMFRSITSKLFDRSLSVGFLRQIKFDTL